MRVVLAILIALCFLGMAATANACESSQHATITAFTALSPSEAKLEWTEPFGVFDQWVQHSPFKPGPLKIGAAPRSYTFTDLLPKTTYEADLNASYEEHGEVCQGNTAVSSKVTTPAFAGVNSHAPWFWEVTEAEVKREIVEAQALGVHHLRIPIEWGAIETSAGSRPSSSSLTRLDLIVNESAAHGIKVDGTIDPTPSWASVGGAWNDSPSNPESARPFARWLTERYGSKLVAIGCLNEPNNAGNYLKPNGAAFSSISELAAAVTAEDNAIYLGAHEGNPAIKVLAGESGNAGGYFSDIVADGVKMDAAGLHAYANGGPPTNTKGEIEEAHAISGKPVWVNEWGYSNEDSETLRAEYTRKGVEYHQSFSYVEGWAYYQLHDTNTGTGHEESFGLLKHDFTPRPSFTAFKEGLK